MLILHKLWCAVFLEIIKQTAGSVKKYFSQEGFKIPSMWKETATNFNNLTETKDYIFLGMMSKRSVKLQEL